MAFVKLDPAEWQRFMRRVAIIGPPNSWKTSSLRTFPRPLHILSYPGEHGAASIPQEEGISAYVWKEATTPQSATSVMNEVIQTTLDIIAGKHGECKTFAGDGFHKFYTIIHESELDGLKAAFPNQDEDKLSGRAFGLAHNSTYRYFRKVVSSAVPYVVFTMWAGKDKDDKDDPNSQSHIWPDLPGEMAKRVLGEFGLCLYAKPGQEVAPGKYSAGTWQTRPQGKVWGAGQKLPLEVSARIPTYVPQDWPALERLIIGGTPATPASPGRQGGGEGVGAATKPAIGPPTRGPGG